MRACASCDKLSEESNNLCHLNKLIHQDVDRLSLELGALPSSHEPRLRHQNGFTLVLSDSARTKSQGDLLYIVAFYPKVLHRPHNSIDEV